LNDHLHWAVHTQTGKRHATPPPTTSGSTARALDLRTRKRRLSVTPLIRLSPGETETTARTLVHRVSPMNTGAITPRIVTSASIIRVSIHCAGSPLVLGASAKPFACECGVRFSNEVTLRGHKQFYCSGAPSLPREGEENASPASPKKTLVVDDAPATHAFVLTCKQCGYKAHS